MHHLLIVLFLGITSVQAQKDVNVSFNIEVNEAIQIDVFKFYISNVELIFEDNSRYSEANSYHLINQEKPSTLDFTLSDIPNKKISSIRFTVGTDSLANVSGAMSGDLDPILGMYWAWNSGYINFKIEGKKDNQAFTFHIGGYAGNQATATAVAYPVQSDSISINVSPAAFLNQVDLSQDHMIMIPGPRAVEMTNYYQTTFSVE